MANPCRELSSYMDCPNEEHWKCIERAVGYIKFCKGKGVKTKTPRDLTIISYCDSNYATNPDDRKSVSGMIHTIGGMLLNWCSRKQKIVTLSSTKAEYVALSKCAQETKFEWMLLNELTGATKPAIIYEDNTGAIFLVKNQQVGPRTKHINVRHHHIRQQVADGMLDVRFIKSEQNISDIMTKNCPEKTFQHHCQNLLDGNIESWREDDSGCHDQPKDGRTEQK